MFFHVAQELTVLIQITKIFKTQCGSFSKVAELKKTMDTSLITFSKM